MVENTDNLKEAFFRCWHDKMLFMPVFARASESVKVNPLIHDDKAVEITDKISRFCSPSIIRKDNLSHYALIFKTLCFDRLVKDYIWRYPGGTVINIGSGLDTTCLRLDTGSVCWYDLDLPEVIDLRKYFINENEKRKFISSSFLSYNWFTEILSDGPVLVFASGVYYYYSEAAIKKFFAKLCLTFPSIEMLFDVTSPSGVRSANRLIRKTGMTGGPFLKWGLYNCRTILGWNPRIKYLGTYRIFNSNCFLLPLKWFIPGLLSDALSIEYILHLRTSYDYRLL